MAPDEEPGNTGPGAIVIVSGGMGSNAMGRHRPFGVRGEGTHGRMELQVHRHGPPTHDGLLEGVTGVQLVRYAAATGVPPVSGWDACLLLDGGRT